MCTIIYGPWQDKTCFGDLGTTKVQTSLRIRAVWSVPLLFPFLESIISKLATCEISIFKLVSVAEELDLSLALWETPKTGFVATKPIFSCNSYTFQRWWWLSGHRCSDWSMFLYCSHTIKRGLLCFDTLCPSQQIFSHVGTNSCHSGLNHYYAAGKASVLLKDTTQWLHQHESRNSNLLIRSLMLYQLSLCTPLKRFTD